MKLYIVSPYGKGESWNPEGVYHLLSEEGEHLASHFCSRGGFARGDLEADRPERKEEWKKRFGEYVVVWLGDDDMTIEELIKRNKRREICL